MHKHNPRSNLEDNWEKSPIKYGEKDTVQSGKSKGAVKTFGRWWFFFVDGEKLLYWWVWKWSWGGWLIWHENFLPCNNNIQTKQTGHQDQEEKIPINPNIQSKAGDNAELLAKFSN